MDNMYIVKLNDHQLGQLALDNVKPESVKTGGGVLHTTSTLTGRVVHKAILTVDGRLLLSFVGKDGVTPDASIVVSSATSVE